MPNAGGFDRAAEKFMVRDIIHSILFFVGTQQMLRRCRTSVGIKTILKSAAEVNDMEVVGIEYYIYTELARKSLQGSNSILVYSRPTIPGQRPSSF